MQLTLCHRSWKVQSQPLSLPLHTMAAIISELLSVATKLCTLCRLLTTHSEMSSSKICRCPRSWGSSMGRFGSVSCSAPVLDTFAYTAEGRMVLCGLNSTALGDDGLPMLTVKAHGTFPLQIVSAVEQETSGGRLTCTRDAAIWELVRVFPDTAQIDRGPFYKKIGHDSVIGRAVLTWEHDTIRHYACTWAHCQHLVSPTGGMLRFSIQLGINHKPNWRTPSFFRGVGWNHAPTS